MTKNIMNLVEENNTIKNTYTFTVLVEAKMCNPNGDPDMGNLPRQDMETGIGFITDVAFKRRIRNYIGDAYAGEDGMDIYMQQGVNLNKEIARAIMDVNGIEKIDKNFKNKKEKDAAALLAKRFWDIRTFGGVLSTGHNAGQITGPVQFGIAESVDPIHIEDMSITRMCYCDSNFETIEEFEKEAEVKSSNEKRTMGDKKIASYGLYIVQGTISPCLAMRTGFSETDLNRLFEAIMQMYDFDNTASKQGMKVISPLIIFKHVGTHPGKEGNDREALLGCIPAHKLYNMLHVQKKDEVEFPRNFEDYNVLLTIPETLRGVSVGLKDSAFADIVWNDNLEHFKEVAADNHLQVL